MNMEYEYLVTKPSTEYKLDREKGNKYKTRARTRKCTDENVKNLQKTIRRNLKTIKKNNKRSGIVFG